jgi:polysaccharide chain length determinant protein (PEP-CTERM system associated)
MTEQFSKAVGLDFIRGVWSRRKWLAIVVFLLPFAATVGAIPALPDVYKGSAAILVERQQVPEEFVKSTVTSRLETRLHTMSEEILSRARLADLIERYDLYPKLRARLPLESVTARMRQDLRVELKNMEALVRGGAIVAFTVSYLGTDPKKVAAVANTLASYYLDENARARERQAAGTAEFLRRELEDVRGRLERQEQVVRAFKNQHVGESPQDMQSNLMVLERLNTQLRLNSDNQSRAAERQESLRRQISDAESLGSLLSDPAVSGLGGGGSPSDPSAARLARLNQQLAELRSRFSEKYPDVVALKKEIATLEHQAAEARAKAEPEAPGSDERGPNPFLLQLKQALDEVDAELKTLKAEDKRLRGDLAIYQRRVENAPRLEQEFVELTRGYETTADLHRTLLKRYEEAQLAETLEQRQKGEQFRVLEAAIPPAAPFGPNRPRLLMMAVVASVGLARGAVLLAEQLNSSFHSLEELRAFNPSVVATIPRILTEADARRRRWRFRLGAVAVVLAVGLAWSAASALTSRSEQVVWILTRDRS